MAEVPQGSRPGGEQGGDALVRRTIADLSPLPTFDQASQHVLRFLHARLGMGLWVVTRTTGPDWIVLHSLDTGYGVRVGDVLPMADTPCARMVRGEGPRVAPDTAAVPAYRDAPVARVVPIGSYVGVPLTAPDGSLFGTLCAVAPEAARPDLIDEQALVELQAQLLSSLLATELRALEADRRADAADRRAHCDALTGLLNRRGWDSALASEEARAARYAGPCSVLALDLDGLKAVNDSDGHAAGDVVIRTAGALIADTCRSGDVTARLGGDEFGVLAVETTVEDAERLRERLQQRFDQAGVGVSIGLAGRVADGALAVGGLAAAWERADAELCDRKRLRRQVLTGQHR